MEDLTGTTRRRVRDKIFELKVIERTVKDIYRLLEVEESDDLSANVISLWDYQRQKKAGLDPVFEPEKLGIKNADFWTVRAMEERIAAKRAAGDSDSKDEIDGKPNPQ